MVENQSVSGTKYCLGMAGRFSSIAAVAACFILVLVYLFLQHLQVSVLDSDLIQATDNILSVFGAAIQSTSPLATKEGGAAEDQRKKLAKAPPCDGCSFDPTSGINEFVAHYGDDDDNQPSLRDAVFVRLINPDGTTAAEAPINKHWPGISEALRRMGQPDPGMQFGFAGGNRLPMLRVETSEIGQYRLQVARSWNSQAAWLYALTLWLTALGAAFSFLAGSGGYSVARRTLAPVLVRPQVQAQVILEKEVPVSRRTLVEQPQASSAPIVTQEESPAKIASRRILAEDETEQQQQIIGRTPPDT